MTNASWYSWNSEEKKFELSNNASEEAILSHKNFYEED